MIEYQQQGQCSTKKVTHLEQFADGISTVNDRLQEIESRLGALVRRIGSPESKDKDEGVSCDPRCGSSEESGLHEKFVERMRTTAQTYDQISQKIALLEKWI